MKARPVLLVIITLVIGFILGMLTSAQIRFNRLRPVRLYFSEERFREGFYRAIQPDEKQREEIEKILIKYARINSELQGDFRKELDSNMKEFRKELESKLNKEQLARLKEIDERRQEMIRQGRRNRENDSLDNRDFRRGDFSRRPLPGDHPPGDRPRGDRPPEFRPPLPPPDSGKLPDNK